MSGITGTGTTYGLPNFTGELFLATPEDTPFLSAIGGLTGGRQAKSTRFEWQGYDLRTAGQNVALEGAAAPTAQERVRFSVDNVCQIHQESVKVSYTKQAATGSLGGLAIEGSNPVVDEVAFQVSAHLKQMARDVEWSFLNGTYQLPTDNTSARKTRGLLSAISTNSQRAAASVGTATVVASTGVWTSSAAHGLVVGDQVSLGAITTTTGVSADTVYYVKTAPTSTTFTLSATNGGALLTFTGDGSTTAVYKGTALTTTMVDNLMQSAFDNGGISEQETATLICNSFVKRSLSAAYGNLYGKYTELSRNVGGVNLTTIQTDFGTLNIMLNRHMPAHKLAIVGLEQCAPVFLEIPGKGHLFVEELAKTGASFDHQLYGEIGLEYGNEKEHALLSGLLVA